MNTSSVEARYNYVPHPDLLRFGVIEAPSRIRKRPSMDIPNPAGELGWGSHFNNWEFFVTDDSTSDVHSGKSLQQLGVLRCCRLQLRRALYGLRIRWGLGGRPVGTRGPPFLA